MKLTRIMPFVSSALLTAAGAFALGADERFVVMTRSSMGESVLFFGTASLLFLVLFVLIHWGVRRD